MKKRKSSANTHCFVFVPLFLIVKTEKWYKNTLFRFCSVVSYVKKRKVMQNHTVPFFVPLFLMAKKDQCTKTWGKTGVIQNGTVKQKGNIWLWKLL